MEWWPWNFLTLSLPCSIRSACTSSTTNLKWSILVYPEFARHITVQFRTEVLSNHLNSFMYHVVIFFFPKDRFEGFGLLDQPHRYFRCNLELIQAFAFPVYILFASFLFPLHGKSKSLSLLFVFTLQNGHRSWMLSNQFSFLWLLPFYSLWNDFPTKTQGSHTVSFQDL